MKMDFGIWVFENLILFALGGKKEENIQQKNCDFILSPQMYGDPLMPVLKYKIE